MGALVWSHFWCFGDQEVPLQESNRGMGNQFSNLAASSIADILKSQPCRHKALLDCWKCTWKWIIRSHYSIKQPVDFKYKPRTGSVAEGGFNLLTFLALLQKSAGEQCEQLLMEHNFYHFILDKIDIQYFTDTYTCMAETLSRSSSAYNHTKYRDLHPTD